MGRLNLLKGAYFGKVGETVGSKWKNLSTVRTYSKPSNPNTDAQQEVRSVFASMTAFVALFADQIKYLSALDTSGMSVRNAIIKANKEQIASGTFTASTLAISKGSLPKPTGVAESSGTVTWTAPTATNITANCKAVIVAVDATNKQSEVKTALASAATATLTTVTSPDHIYVYFLDTHGTTKVASASTYLAG